MKRLVRAVAIALLAGLALSACAEEQMPFPPKLLHYTFDTDSGTTVVDSSGAGRDGLRVGATPIDGPSGGALSFDGADDYVAAGALEDIGTAWSVAFWFQSRVMEEGRTLFEGNWTDDFIEPSAGLTISTSPNGGGLVGYNLDIWSVYIASVNPDEWHHVAVVYDEGTATGYFDGRKTYEMPDLGSPASFSNVQLGRGTASGALQVSPYFHGELDDVRVYDGALNWINVGDLVFADAD